MRHEGDAHDATPPDDRLDLMQVAPDGGLHMSVPFSGPIDWTALAKEVAEKRERAVALRLGAVEAPTDLRAVVVTLIEALADVREQFDAYDPSGELRQRYAVFRAALEQAGLPLEHGHRFERAAAHRRLGELAEGRGDLLAAALHYDLAIRARRDVGCARRLTRIHQYLEARAARQG